MCVNYSKDNEYWKHTALERLFEKIFFAEVDEVKKMISDGVDINASLPVYWLHLNTKLSPLPSSNLLLCPHNNIPDATRYTAMHCIVHMAGFYESEYLSPHNNLQRHWKPLCEKIEAMAVLLFDAGFDVEARDEYGRTLCHVAAVNQCLDLMELFIRHGSDRNTRFRSTYPNRWRHHGCNVPNALTIRGQNFTVNATGLFTPLLLTATVDKEHLCRFIHSFLNAEQRSYLAKVVDDSRKSTTPLSQLAQTCPVLLQMRRIIGIDVNEAVDPVVRRTPLHYAAMMGMLQNTIDSVQTLLALGADVNAKDAHGRTPIMYALMSALDNHSPSQEHSAVVHLLRAEGADLSVVDRWGYTVLHYIANFGDHIHQWYSDQKSYTGDSISKLVCGSTVPPVAAARGEKVPFRDLLMPQVNSRCRRGKTPLHVASGGLVATALIKMGAVVDARDDDGYTPLLRAAERGAAAVFEALLKAGAAPDALCQKYGQTAVHKCIRFLRMNVEPLDDCEEGEGEPVAEGKAEKGGDGEGDSDDDINSHDDDDDDNSTDDGDLKTEGSVQNTGYDIAFRCQSIRLFNDPLCDMPARDENYLKILRSLAPMKVDETPKMSSKKKPSAPPVGSPILNVDAVDKSGHTALQIACRHANTPPIVLFLLKAGSNPSQRDAKGNTLFHYAVCESLGVPTVDGELQRFLALPRDARSRGSLTPISKLAQQIKIDTTLISARNNDGDTPMLALFRRGDFPKTLFTILKGAGGSFADVDIATGMNGLHIAAATDNRKLIDFLTKRTVAVQQPLDPLQIDAKGWTPLHHAAHNDCASAVKRLLKLAPSAAVQRTLQNGDDDPFGGKTPYDLALINGKSSPNGALAKSLSNAIVSMNALPTAKGQIGAKTVRSGQNSCEKSPAVKKARVEKQTK